MSATPNPGGVNYTLTIVGQLWTTHAERIQSDPPDQNGCAAW
jgi:hypothetical protein